MDITIIDLTSDVVFNYFASIFIWFAVVLVPFFAILSLIKESS